MNKEMNVSKLIETGCEECGTKVFKMIDLPSDAIVVECGTGNHVWSVPTLVSVKG